MHSLVKIGWGAAALAIALVAVTTPAPAQLDKLLKGLSGQGSGLSDAKIADGLKEALQVATGKTVSLTGKTDGYFGNQAIKIRAAESAAPRAKQIFLDAIGKMSFDDARKILNGGDTAATEFFRSKTTPQLTTAFRPVVSKSMNDVGVTRQYKDLVSRFDAIPFARSQTFDLDGYVVDKGLGGLFHVLGDQEKDIRTNPSARATDLLKEVFKR
jgi:Protein of unknown function (DUF4197)